VDLHLHRVHFLVTVEDETTFSNTAVVSPLLSAYLIQSSSIFIELLVSGIASVVYKINGRH